MKTLANLFRRVVIVVLIIMSAALACAVLDGRIGMVPGILGAVATYSAAHMVMFGY